MSKLDTEELKRKAMAARDSAHYSWYPSYEFTTLDTVADGRFIEACSPQVVLALIARTEELAAILGETLADVGPSFVDDPLYVRIEDCIGKGVVLP